jgi:hypothetical protein
MILFAKIFTYALNAYLDAQIAEEIVAYIKSGGKTFATKNTVAQQRAEKLVATNSEVFQEDPSYLIGLAYTEYYLNGLADILYANLFWSFLISKRKSYLRGIYRESITRFRAKLSTTFQFEEIISKPGISLWYWPLVVTDPWRWTNQFAKERCGYSGELNRDALRKASIEVQHQNIQNNKQLTQILIKHDQSSDHKVIEIRKVAEQLNNSTAFLSEAVATQEAAIKWDKLFMWLINR